MVSLLKNVILLVTPVLLFLFSFACALFLAPRVFDYSYHPLKHFIETICAFVH